MLNWVYRAITLFGALLLSFAAMADPREAGWIKLSEARVGSGLETAVVQISPDTGAFDRISLEANGSDLLVHEIRAYFADGDMQRVANQVTVPRNGGVASFELEGGARRLERIEMTLKCRPAFFGRQALVSVWARQGGADEAAMVSAAASFDPEWELLGKETVGPAVAHNVIAIGQDEGRFDALRLRVLHTDVAFHDIRVVYPDGNSQTLVVRKLLRAGDMSPPLTLPGEARFIQEIELVHEANPEMQGKAVVQIWARRPSR